MESCPSYCIKSPISNNKSSLCTAICRSIVDLILQFYNGVMCRCIHTLRTVTWRDLEPNPGNSDSVLQYKHSKPHRHFSMPSSSQDQAQDPHLPPYSTASPTTGTGLLECTTAQPSTKYTACPIINSHCIHAKPLRLSHQERHLMVNSQRTPIRFACISNDVTISLHEESHIPVCHLKAVKTTRVYTPTLPHSLASSVNLVQH